MKFSYVRFPSKPSKVFPETSIIKPIIHIALKNGENTIDTFALIDSGADYCISSAEFGEALGLSVENEFGLDIYGISGKPIKFYFHNIKIIIGGWEKNCKMGFSREFMMDFVILGQKGFFDLFKITFDYKREIIELK